MPSSKKSRRGTTTVKARYLGPVLLNGPGDQDALNTAVERLRTSAQVARASMHISSDSVKITDRAGKDVLLLAERDNICCHGIPPGTITFLGLVVNQGSRYYCHVINMPRVRPTRPARHWSSALAAATARSSQTGRTRTSAATVRA